MIALPLAAFFLLLESATGGAIALFLVHLRGEVSRGFVLFTGACLWLCALLALWLRASFPPRIEPQLEPQAALWFAAERTLLVAFLFLLGMYLVLLYARRTAAINVLRPVIPLAALGALWSAALVQPGTQLFGLGAPLATLAGGLALGSAITGLSLGHWYLVAPTLSTRPLIQLNFLCLGALVAQTVLLVPLLFLPLSNGQSPFTLLLGEHALFFGVRVVFGLLVPLGAAFGAWRTARIRSLDSATGLWYIVAALILAGEIAARALYFLSGVAT